MEEDKFNQFLCDIETTLKQIQEGKARCYKGKYNGKKEVIEISMKRGKKIQKHKRR